MVDDLAILLAVRTHLLTLSVVDASDAFTGTATGYTRAAGSFVADGFVVGMEVVPSLAGVDRAVGVVLSVTAGVINISNSTGADADRLRVGLPQKQAWENMIFEPTDRLWYMEEDYLPGPRAQITLGPNGELDIEPAYVLRLYGIAGSGVGALYHVASSVLRLFRPGLAMQTTDGTIVRVRSDPAPFRGQTLNQGGSHAAIAITIPLRARTTIN